MRQQYVLQKTGAMRAAVNGISMYQAEVDSALAVTDGIFLWKKRIGKLK